MSEQQPNILSPEEVLSIKNELGEYFREAPESLRQKWADAIHHDDPDGLRDLQKFIENDIAYIAEKDRQRGELLEKLRDNVDQLLDTILAR